MYISSSIQLLLQASEPEVAVHFNISTAQLRAFRAEHLKQLTVNDAADDPSQPILAGDWHRQKHNKVYFTAAGLAKIMEWLGLKTATPALQAVEVTVVGNPPNPHMLKCTLEDGTLVNVKVRSQVGFLKGMKLSVRSDPGSTLLIYKGPNPLNTKMERHFYKV